MTAPDPSQSFLARHQFLIYRLFSLAGLVPVGAFLVVHLLTNASVLAGPGTFQSRVDMIHSLGPLLVPIEWAFIFLPMLFHAVIGFVIIANGLPNVGSYAYVGNVRYTLQRATGMIAFALSTSTPRMPPSAPRPAAPSISPTATLTALARRIAAGLVHRPHVMPSVHSPFEKWNTVDRMPTAYRMDTRIGRRATAAELVA